MSLDPSSLYSHLVRLDVALASLAQVAPVGGGGGAPAGGGGAAPAPASGGAPAAGGGGSSMMNLLLPVLIFVGFYFFLIRPQQKKQQELESKLKKGDKVLTTGGISGKIIELRDKRAIVEIAQNVRIEILRTAISGIDEGDAPAKDAVKDDEKAKPADAKK